ncbi:DUF2798 domain-containing protein [Nevskia soli]|uniref:DUF2798 domain-containing protein n=1 Tax=Nevskia soli TaxID=418856 RepID=UPI000A00F587
MIALVSRVPGRYSHYLFGAIQSGLTCFVASGISSASLVAEGHFLGHWLRSWLLAWGTMLPIVIVAAPAIRKIVVWLSAEE